MTSSLGIGKGIGLARRRALGVLVALALGATAPPLAAQPIDIAAAQKRFDDLYATGRYQAALTEALKTEAAAKRGGGNTLSYVLALNDLGRAYQALGRYGEAERAFRQVVETLKRNVPPNDAKLIQATANLAKAYLLLGRAREAEPMFRAAIEASSAAGGKPTPALATLTMNMGDALRAQARYQDAEAHYARALDMAERSAGPDSIQVAETLNNLTKIYEDQGRFSEAETALVRARAINETVRGPDHPEVAYNINNLAHLYERLGRYAEADRAYQRAIAMWEKALGPKHPDLATALNNLAVVYVGEERFDEAEALYRRALSIREEAFGRQSTEAATVLNNLAQLYELQARFVDVEDYSRRALAIVEKTLGPDNPDTAKVVRKLGVALEGQGRFEEADRQFKRALDAFVKTFGPDHRFIATVLASQARLFERQRRYREADGALRRALAINETTRGANHPEVARNLNQLAKVAAAQGEARDALAYSRRATAAVLAHAAADGARPRSGEAGGLVEQRSSYFVAHVGHASAAAQAAIEPNAALAEEAFEMAQWANQSAAATAVQQMGARAAAGDDALAKLVRENQDLTAFWRARDRALSEALSKPTTPDNTAVIAAIRKQLAETDQRLADAQARLRREFQDYAALTNPSPMTVNEVTAQLGPDEALLLLIPGESESYVFALSRDGHDWKRIPIGADALTDRIAAFRRGLFVDGSTDFAKRKETFDIGLSHELYETLLGPVAGVFRDKRNLLVAPSGPLTALPFHLLVTESPTGGAKRSGDAASYREAAWLIRRHAVTVLPAVASLRALRVLSRADQGSKPLLGFGDPVFGPERGPGVESTRGFARGAATRAYSEFWRGAGVDRAKIAETLTRLQETADELRAIAAKLGAPDSDVRLRERASEAAVKEAALSDYRIVYFATHGLVAGDVKGLAEPSLALTMPQQASSEDDGLLTASEIAQLKLKADWVVLSACNTIAGDKPGAEALSGLARAFFYAGARALLVSHWAVESNAATQLTTTAFDIMAADPSIGRAEALRQAMLAHLDDQSSDQKADPALWGPFSIVGEGALR